MNFEFHVKGLEDACVAAIRTQVGAGVNEVALYQGELSSSEDVRQALGTMARRFPLMLVAYGSSGKPRLHPATGAQYGAPHVYTMPCTITIVSIDRVTRGTEQKTQRGVYAMLSDAFKAITDRHFYATQTGQPVLDEPEIEASLDDLVLLNSQPMTPEAIESLARVPNATAYAQTFSTAFDFTSEDRRLNKPITTIDIGVDVPNRKTVAGDKAPGVHPQV